VYICICNRVTDSDIRRAADTGVRSIRQLKKATGCTSKCGSCEQMASEVLNEALSERGSFLNIGASPIAA
jgi:bacterioferritin-associated ferredoxin